MEKSLKFLPGRENLENLIGCKRLTLFEKACHRIESLYAIAPVWGNGGKKWLYECKYRCGSKTLCAFYFNSGVLGLQIIFGAAERSRFEKERECHSGAVQNAYDAAVTYHDGKWMMLDLSGDESLSMIEKVLNLKRKV